MDSDTQDTVDTLLDVQESSAIIRLMEQNEEVLHDLYNHFARQFPEYVEFWLRIAYDEKDHANWISQLYNQINTGRLNFEKERFDQRSLYDFYEYVSQKISQFEKEPYSIEKALSLSVEIEDTMIEKDFFRVFDVDNQILKTTLNKLRTSTLIHFQKVKDLLESVNNKA